MIHPEDKINLKGVSIVLNNGIISKIGELSSEESKDTREFDFTGKIFVPDYLICTFICVNQGEKMKKQ